MMLKKRKVLLMVDDFEKRKVLMVMLMVDDFEK
jgi:hypothetical protein